MAPTLPPTTSRMKQSTLYLRVRSFPNSAPRIFCLRTTSCRGVIRWHLSGHDSNPRQSVSRVALDWGLWKTLYHLSYSAAAPQSKKFNYAYILRAEIAISSPGVHVKIASAVALLTTSLICRVKNFQTFNKRSPLNKTCEKILGMPKVGDCLESILNHRFVRHSVLKLAWILSCCPAFLLTCSNYLNSNCSNPPPLPGF